MDWVIGRSVGAFWATGVWVAASALLASGCGLSLEYFTATQGGDGGVSSDAGRALDAFDAHASDAHASDAHAVDATVRGMRCSGGGCRPRRVAASADHSCAIVDRRLWCWGRGGDGQLGRGDALDSAQAGAVSFDSPESIEPIEVVAGHSHTCVRTAGDAGVFCFGDSSVGAVGIEAADDIVEPRVVFKAEGVPLLAISLAAGSRHTCAVDPSGDVYCWGFNSDGQLGSVLESGITYTATPTLVTGLPAPAILVAAGGGRTCAALDDASIYCWGVADPDLGDGSTRRSTAPVRVTIVPRGYAHSLDVEEDHACAAVGESVFCWGKNQAGQLGGPNPYNPAQVVFEVSHAAREVSVGPAYSCALRAVDGVAMCWGYGQHSQTNDPTLNNRIEAVDIAPETTGDSIASGWMHSCVGRAGDVVCWGRDSYGQRGDGAPAIVDVPREVLSPSAGHWTRLVAGSRAACAFQSVAEGSALHCFGWNISMQLGGLMTGAWSSPREHGWPSEIRPDGGVPLPDRHRLVDVALGSAHACYVDVEGRTACRGWNGNGQAARGASGNFLAPVLDATGSPHEFTRVAAGNTHSCGIATDGDVWCWGDSRRGQIGVATPPEVNPVPRQVPGLSVGQIKAGFEFTCAITDGDGERVRCWGDSRFGQSGIVSAEPVPPRTITLASGDLSATDLGAGFRTACAVNRNDRGIYCWGASLETSPGPSPPVVDPAIASRVNDLPDSHFSDVEVGESHACALAVNGGLYCWGNNERGALGTSRAMAHPVSAPVLTDVESFVVGEAYTCARTVGGVYCWGDGYLGSLGNNEAVTIPVLSPVVGIP